MCVSNNLLPPPPPPPHLFLLFSLSLPHSLPPTGNGGLQFLPIRYIQWGPTKVLRDGESGYGLLTFYLETSHTEHLRGTPSITIAPSALTDSLLSSQELGADLRKGEPTLVSETQTEFKLDPSGPFSQTYTNPQ